MKASPGEAMLGDLIHREVLAACRVDNALSHREVETQQARAWIFSDAPHDDDDTFLTTQRLADRIWYPASAVCNLVERDILRQGEHYIIGDDGEPSFHWGSVRSWMDETLFSFDRCCELVNLDPDYLRGLVRRAIRGEIACVHSRLLRISNPEVVAA